MVEKSRFSFIKPRPVPAKANPIEQAAFVEKYEKLKKEIPEDGASCKVA
ncbi:hypothetical protein FACS189472_16110 [Alphaproteobacteria bacterium]|nr:hypothetical protein FACS189472_16110 [Alphaproteobacteria bacterium]